LYRSDLKASLAQDRVTCEQRLRDRSSDLQRPLMVPVITVEKRDDQTGIGYTFHFLE
jgi:hypothetical protein